MVQVFFSIVSFTFYPNGLWLPWAVKGWFLKRVLNGKELYDFFQSLVRDRNAKATVWQEVFFAQLAGVVIRTDKHTGLHIRFFLDGTIFAEIEHHRWFNPAHFEHQPTDASDELRKLLIQYGLETTIIRTLWNSSRVH